MIGIDFANTPRPLHKIFLSSELDVTDKKTSEIAIESNIPQMLEIIIVNGENSQNLRAHLAPFVDCEKAHLNMR
jgi:hypothetical protein